jgi:hypothetical protein
MERGRCFIARWAVLFREFLEVCEGQWKIAPRPDLWPRTLRNSSGQTKPTSGVPSRLAEIAGLIDRTLP